MKKQMMTIANRPQALNKRSTECYLWQRHW